MIHNEDMRRLLNVREVKPFLNKQLLTPDEMERLELRATRYDKVDYLVSILGSKGDKAPSLFIECVKQAKEHRGHDELGKIMEQSLQQAPPPNTEGAGATASQYHPPPQQQCQHIQSNLGT